MELGNSSHPLVSAIMGIYNCEDTLGEALACIIHQTYDNWEIILCDDASTDNTKAVAEQYVQRFPEKIRLLRNETNQGLNYTLNKCLMKAKGEYIARMDGDDTCSPDRFEKEVGVLNNNPDIAIVSTDMLFFDEIGIWGRTNAKERPEPNDFIKETQFCHAACMVRKEAYDAVGGYTVDKKLLRVEDYHLWIKMYGKGYRGINIKEPLYQMRDDRNAIKRKKFKYRVNEAYVKTIAIRSFSLPVYSYLACLKPIILGFMPSGLYRTLHRMKR